MSAGRIGRNRPPTHLESCRSSKDHNAVGTYCARLPLPAVDVALISTTVLFRPNVHAICSLNKVFIHSK